MYALSEAIYEETDLYFINPEIYFLDNEIEIYKTFKVDVSKSKNLIEFNNMIQINESHWIGKISVKYLAELYNNLKITYNPQTQRESGYFEDNGRLIFVPKTYPISVKEIKTKILTGTYEPDEITLNLLKDGNEKFEYDKNNMRIIIYNGRLDIIDGWHRSSAILEALADNPNLDISFELRFTNFDVQKARDFIIQKNKQRKINEKHIQSMNVSDYHNSIAKTLNENQKSDFKGKIVSNKHLINRGYGLVMFDVIADSIEANFEIKTRSQSEFIQEFLINYFNELYNILYDEFEERKGIYTESFSFIGYIAIASEIYSDSNWKDLMIEALSEIDFSENNLFYNEIKPQIENKLSKQNIKRISKYFKKTIKRGELNE